MANSTDVKFTAREFAEMLQRWCAYCGRDEDGCASAFGPGALYRDRHGMLCCGAFGR